MIKVEPKVFLIAYTHLDEDAVREWLTHLGGQKCLDHVAGSDAEKLIELSARRCYKSFDVGLNPNVTQIPQRQHSISWQYSQEWARISL